MSTNGIKLSINNATKNSLKRRVYVCQPWPGPLGADPRYAGIVPVSLSFFVAWLWAFYCLAGHPRTLLPLPLALRQVTVNDRSAVAYLASRTACANQASWREPRQRGVEGACRDGNEYSLLLLRCVLICAGWILAGCSYCG